MDHPVLNLIFAIATGKKTKSTLSTLYIWYKDLLLELSDIILKVFLTSFIYFVHWTTVLLNHLSNFLFFSLFSFRQALINILIFINLKTFNISLNKKFYIVVLYLKLSNFRAYVDKVCKFLELRQTKKSNIS